MSENLPQRLTPDHIRAVTFPTVGTGIDPDAVDGFLDQIADELARLQQRLADTYAETDRVRRRLRDWQRDHLSCRRPDPRVPGHRPEPRSGGPRNAPGATRWITQPPYPPARDA